MAETRDGRAERREEIKLRLEYLKVAISLGVIGTLLFAGLQWRMANQAALQTNCQRIVSDWRNHLATFVEKPLLRPYFEGRKKLTDDDPNREVSSCPRRCEARRDRWNFDVCRAAGRKRCGRRVEKHIHCRFSHQSRAMRAPARNPSELCDVDPLGCPPRVCGLHV